MNVEAEVSFDLLRKLLEVATCFFSVVLFLWFWLALFFYLSSRIAFCSNTGQIQGSFYSHWSYTGLLTSQSWPFWCGFVCLLGIFSFSGCKFRISFTKLYSKVLLGTSSVPTRFWWQGGASVGVSAAWTAAGGQTSGIWCSRWEQPHTSFPILLYVGHRDWIKAQDSLALERLFYNSAFMVCFFFSKYTTLLEDSEKRLRLFPSMYVPESSFYWGEKKPNQNNTPQFEFHFVGKSHGKLCRIMMCLFLVCQETFWEVRGHTADGGNGQHVGKSWSRWADWSNRTFTGG